MKKAFTMIELIFVIMIIGVLAAVAIPKLVANRDNAKVSNELNSLATYINDVTTYYMATGILNVSHSSAELHCFNISSNTTSATNNTISLDVINGGDANGEEYCNNAQSVAVKKGLSGETRITFGGALISY
jgi:general secretion pathway protein G